MLKRFNWKKIVLTFLGLIILLTIFFIIAIYRYSPQPDANISWGVTFSQKMSEDFKLDWRENYLAIIRDLRPRGIRLVAYWDNIEPQPNNWQFADLDWQVEEARKANIPVILTIGQRVPRWPECFYPSWLNRNNKAERQSELLEYMNQIVEHYKNSPNLLYWQVENEPFLEYGQLAKFGECPKLDWKLYNKEVALVRNLDPTHKILITDGGAWGPWYFGAKRADVFGFTLYNKVYNSEFGSSKPPWPPGYYKVKRTIMRFLTGKWSEPYIVAEAGLEPWGGKQIFEMTMDEQQDLLTPQEFETTLQFMKNTGFDTYYMWGAEWWYAAKQNGVSAYWDKAKQTITSGKGLPMNSPTSFSFPKDFLWGAGTASHQVEGNTHNNWSEWEKKNAEKLAKNAAKQKNLPDREAAITPHNYISGRGADQYHLYNQDFALAQSLGMNSQRISLEWSRIEPQSGQFDEAEIKHYVDEIASMKAHGQEPMITLWHWTEPLWFTQKGGWANVESRNDFAEYVQVVASRLGPSVTYWITLNEPQVYTTYGYLTGTWPPQRRNPLAYSHALENLVIAHNRAYDILKQANPKAQVGIAQNMGDFKATSPVFINNIGRNFYTQNWNFWFVKKIQNKEDFIGLNYYRSKTVSFGWLKDTGDKKSDLGWGLDPAGIYDVLVALKPFNKPIFITENGLADANDVNRGWFITESLKSVAKAMQAGVPVKGYYHWSLIDNFEWSSGFWPRFGLIAVDYSTLERTPRPSALTYKKIIRANAVGD